jgi:type I restriction enzyme, R subunit
MTQTVHNEDSRVKLPALLHFKRLGYEYQSKKKSNIDPRNNIFVDVFSDSIKKINNKDFNEDSILALIKDIYTLTDNSRDKGKSFYERLTEYNAVKLIDLKNPHNNDFRVVTELTFANEREEFRPDITILINGIPLAFIEVKKPNNEKGIQAEFNRMEYRLKVSEFNHFFNQFQVLAFTNNQPYDDESRIKLQGSFYTAPNGKDTTYNHFREERELPVNGFLDKSFIDSVLLDNSLMSIKDTAEFDTNLNPESCANKFITSLFSIERLIYFIRYGIAYVDSPRDGLHKHIIRYPQYFAATALEEKLNQGMKRGIVWHTQGSGKTALAFFMSNVLRDYFQKKNIITKFYFVVDRLDLLHQASSEFSSRGMTIASINSKEAFAENIKSPVIVAPSSSEGRYLETMNVVNIHKFSEDSTVDLKVDKKIQRIYFLDEVHRGYKPRGTFLANLLGADKNGIFIGLTGTPILRAERRSTDLFHDYIHKYYYNKSVSDGYTLRIKKENIATEFRTDIREILKLKSGQKIPSARWEEITKQEAFVERLCQYIKDDFFLFRDDLIKDKTLGSMIVTSSSEQARLIQKWFEENSDLKTALVLYDEENNKDKQEEFRGKRNLENGNKIESRYDGVVVYNMLLTGFDAPRLKRLYLLREIREHSLLQTLARVNRPYKDMKYGYIVDFVDITEEYEATNQRYLEELRKDILDLDVANDTNEIFIDVSKVKEQIKRLENILFKYKASIERNLEAFEVQIQPLSESELKKIKDALGEYRDCYNELRMSHEDVKDIPIDRINSAYREVTNRINLKAAERALEDNRSDITDIDFTQLIIDFLKTGEIDLSFDFGNEVVDIIDKIKNGFSSNNDKNDRKFIDLQTEFKKIVWKFKNDSDTAQKVNSIIDELKALYVKIQILNSDNNGLIARYHGDDSCMRIHKRIVESYDMNLSDNDVYNAMIYIIKEIDKSLGSLIQPSQEIIMRQIARPVNKAFKEVGHILAESQQKSIIDMFIDDMFGY